jgi:hypothetical protein
MNTSPSPWENADPALAVDHPAPPAPIGIRLLAGGGGILALLIGGLFTLGTALAAPVAVGLTWWILRRRGRALTRLGSLATAVCGATVMIALAFLLLLANLPEGSLTGALAAAESAEPPPQPEWLERLAPYSAQPDPIVDGVVWSRPAMIYFGLVGFGLGCLVLGSIAGSLGWAATFLLGFAVRGRWPLHPPA